MILGAELERFSSRTALLTDTAEEITYGLLLATADAIGREIKTRSLVFQLCSNTSDSVAGYLGLLRANHVPLLLSSSIDDVLLENLLQTYRPAFVFLPAGRKGIPGSEVHRSGEYALVKTGFAVDYSLADELALLLTTSGSTGSPKLVRLSHKNLRSNAEAIAEYLRIAAEDRPITVLPMSYSFGLSILNSHFIRGASLLVTEKTLMEKTFWESARNGGVTSLSGVPYVFEMLKRLRFDPAKYSRLRYLAQAGGRLRPELCAEFAQLCDKRGIEFFVMYGQTEATARMTYLPPSLAAKKPGSIGIAIPGGKLRLEDAVNDEGELVYEGDNVSLGYAESRADLSKGDENKGILLTGDLARRDGDGHYYVVGRKKRFLKIFGNRVNLAEIEQLVANAGFECACTGTDDNLRIYLTKTDGINQLKAHLSQVTGLNPAALSLIHVDEIPRSDSGKILYANLT